MQTLLQRGACQDIETGAAAARLIKTRLGWLILVQEKGNLQMCVQCSSEIDEPALHICHIIFDTSNLQGTTYHQKDLLSSTNVKKEKR